MENFLPIIVAGAIAVVLFDTLGSFASLAFGFKSQLVSVGSCLIYDAIAFATSKYYDSMFAPYLPQQL